MLEVTPHRSLAVLSVRNAVAKGYQYSGPDVERTDKPAITDR